MNPVYHAITNTDSLLAAHQELDIICGQHPLVEMVLTTDQKRSVQQNKYIYSLYSLATHTPKGEGHKALDIRCICKLTKGVPILYTEDKEFREMYQANIKAFSYEDKIRIMSFFPVTSRMTLPQLSQYIDAIIEEYELPKTQS